LKKNTSISLLLIVSSITNAYSQKTFDKELIIGFGYTRSYNELIQESSNFKIKAVPMMRAFANWEFIKLNDFKFGAGFEFYNTSYEYKDQNLTKTNYQDQVGLYFSSGGFVNVVALSVSAKYQLYNNKYYRLNVKLSPKVGYVVYGYYLGELETLQDRPSLRMGNNFFLERPGKWYSKSIFPLVAFEIENEIKLSKRSGIVVTTGYQQGFKTYFKNPMQFYRNYQTPNETIEPFIVQNKGNMLFYQISYRHYF